MATSAPERNRNHEFRTGACRGIDMQRSTDGLHAFPDPDEPETLLAGLLRRPVDVEADAVVPDVEEDLRLLPVKLDADLGRPRVAQGVVERFPRHPVEHGLDGLRQALRGRLFDRDPQARALRNPFGEVLERRNQAEVLEYGGPQFVRQAAQLFLDLIEQPGRLRNPDGRFRMRLREIGQLDVDRDQQLAGFVVQRVGNALGFLLQHFVEPAQREAGVTKAAIRHLEGRQAFGEKLRRAGDDRLAIAGGFCAGKERRDTLVVNAGEIDERRAFDQSAAPDLVGPFERALANARDIGLEESPVLSGGRLGSCLRQIVSAFVHDSARPYRTRSNRASSFRFLPLSSAASAIDWSGPRKGTAEAASCATPSVLNTSISPAPSVTTLGCRAGSWDPTTPLRNTSRSSGTVGSARRTRPSTLPTPAQATECSRVLIVSRLIVTPRVGRRAS